MTDGPRQILFVITSSDTGGAERALYELTTRLDRERFRPLVCSLRPSGRTASAIDAAGVPVYSMRMAKHPRMHQLIGGAVRLARMIDRLEIDLVQSFLYRANLLASISSLLSSRDPVLVTSQRSLEPLTGRLTVWSARLTRRLSRRIVAVSDAVREDLVTREGLDPGLVVVIPNGVDTAHFRRRQVSALRSRIAVANGETVVGAAGRLTRVKGFESLLHAVNRLLARGVGTQLLIAGEGPRRSSLETLASELGIRDRTHFLGLCEDMTDFYSALDIFALTSLREGSPNVLLEAMSCSCAAIATRVGGVPEIVEDDLSGYLVSPGGLEQLVDALHRLASDVDGRRQLAAEARKRVDSCFSLKQTVAAYEQLYCSLFEASSVSS